MKSYTDIEQSKKLAEILPLESADMCFINNKPQLGFLCEEYYEFGDTILQDYYPCWSLAALLNVLPNGSDVVKEETDTENEKYMCTVGIKNDIISTFADNSVDACYEMILKLHELNLL